MTTGAASSISAKKIVGSAQTKSPQIKQTIDLGKKPAVGAMFHKNGGEETKKNTSGDTKNAPVVIEKQSSLGFFKQQQPDKKVKVVETMV